ncbi:MAG: glycosyltransferase family 4 protein [Pirellulaceae bacterium]|nr:glycosyltransferase family 4 protein [Pirellulaceae bacterium]
MRIIHLVAGAGGMYCGSCLQGNSLCRALLEAGQDVVLVPVYTPIRTDEEAVAARRVAFGGLNVYLQQRSGLFRRAPWCVDRLLDHPALLGRLGGGTRPERLGPLTVSMLRGELGNQRKELEKLVAWFEQQEPPQLIHLSTAMLVGLARTLVERLGAKVVCTLSGEDAFLERLPEPYYAEARNELRDRCRELDALIAPSNYYAEFMADYLAVPSERIAVIRPGLDLEGHEPAPTTPRPAPSTEHPATIGYLSRICPAKGLHQLTEALGILLRDPTLPPLRVVAAGHLGRGDRSYLRQIRRNLDRRGMAAWFEYVGEVDRPGKIAFLQSIDVLSIPTTRPESKGLAALEGWAAGTPAVLPNHGVFSELVARTGGGLLHEPNRPTSLAESLKQMVQNSDMARRCGSQGREAVHRDHDIRSSAQRTIELYRSLGD